MTTGGRSSQFRLRADPWLCWVFDNGFVGKNVVNGVLILSIGRSLCDHDCLSQSCLVKNFISIVVNLRRIVGNQN